MFHNFIVIAFRQLRRNLAYTLINILGLALGLAGSFVMGSWVWQELSYDKHFEDSERIFRVSVSFYNSGAFASGPEILNNTLREIMPEVETATRLDKTPPTTIYNGEDQFEESIFYADSNFFNVFSYPFIKGNGHSALANPNQLVIDTEYAVKFFGTTDVLGKTLEIGEEKAPYLIAGIVQTSDKPSHIDAHIWLPIKVENNESWTSANYYNYIKLKPTADKRDLEVYLEKIKRDYVYPSFNTSVPYDEWVPLNFFDFHVVALEDIYLDPDMRFEMQVGGNESNVYIFLVVALFLVLIAAINFVNLSTAQSIKRAKEVGIRKALGTDRSNLIIQFLLESLVLSLVAMLLGVGLAEIFLILFETFTSELLTNGVFHNLNTVVLYLIFSTLVGILAGVYPAFYLSRFKPSGILKSTANQVRGSGSFRHVLVIVQFTVSIGLIIGSLLVLRQLEYLKEVDLGFDRDNVLIINNASALGDNKESFKNQLLSYTGVESASYTKRMPAGPSIWIYSFKSQAMDKELAFQTFIGDDDFIPTMGLRLIDGRNFSGNIASDSTAVILNESAVKEMLLNNPIGAQLQENYHVIGVVEDFGYQSFQEKPGPVVLLYEPEGYRLSVKIVDGQTTRVLDQVQRQWKAYGVEQPVNYAFLDKNFERLMEKEQTLGKTITFFTVLAIFISCLGLFGLAAYTTEQRQKEIGIRKVLGASVVHVVMLLNKSFTKQVVFSTIIAVPIAWYILDQWLKNFAYKVEIRFWLFMVSGMAALLIAWITVSYLSYRAANANPVDSLRNE